MARFEKQITHVNKLIKQFAPKEYKKEWQVSVMDGTVAFGSAYHNWGITIPYMQKSGVNFTQIFEYCTTSSSVNLPRRLQFTKFYSTWQSPSCPILFKRSHTGF